jgi:hypothetical protein
VRYIPRIAEIDRGTTRRHIELKFSASVMAENYVQVYRKVIQQSKARLIAPDALAPKPAILLGSTPAKPLVPMSSQHQEADPAKRVVQADPLSKSAAQNSTHWPSKKDLPPKKPTTHRLESSSSEAV